MRFVRFASVALLAGITFLLLDCSFLIETPEYSIELAVERRAYNSADAQAVQVTYCVRSTEEEALRARYELTGVDGSLLDSGVISGLVLGVEQSRVLDLSGYPGFIDQGFVEEGKYRFRLVGQTKKADGSYQDLAFLDQTVEFFVDDTPPVGEGDLDVSPPIDQRYATDTEVTILHSELSSPIGSPVEVLYSTNGDDPFASGLVYTGSPFTISNDQGTRIVRMSAVDAAGNASDVVEREYRFARITSLDPLRVTNADTPIVKIYGYGFVNLSPEANVDIKAFDKNGRLIDMRFPPNIISQTELEIILDMDADPSVVADEDVPGQVAVTSHDPDAVTVSHPFFVLPP